MSHPDYDALLERYRELQTRVTRFSSVEQDLINTRDRLDQELISYKRLHSFTERALENLSPEAFHALIVESLVDIFEVESALILFRNLKDQSGLLETEAIDQTIVRDGSLERDLRSWLVNMEKDKVILVGSSDFSGFPSFCRFSRGMLAQFEDQKLGFAVLIMGIVGVEFDPIYPAFSNKNQTMFGIFLKQLQAFFTNRVRNEELKKTNAELDSFVYSVSHDLRAPLLSIQGIIDLLGTTDGMPDDAGAYLDMASIAVQRLDNNIKEILEYSRNSRLQVSPEEFDLGQMIQEIFDGLRFSVHGPMEFKVEPGGVIPVTSDRARIKVLLNNVIANSVKYRRRDIANPFVHVSCHPDQDNFHIQVVDNGEGIPAESMEKVFDMFYRASTTTSGTGLGLYICKEIMAKLNGKIAIRSKAGEGTTVFIQFPIKRNSELAHVRVPKPAV